MSDETETTAKTVTKLFSVNGKTYIGSVGIDSNGATTTVVEKTFMKADSDNADETRFYVPVSYPALIESVITETGEASNSFNVTWSITPLCFSAMLIDSNISEDVADTSTGYVSNTFFFPLEDFTDSLMTSGNLNVNIVNSWKAITGQS